VHRKMIPGSLNYFYEALDMTKQGVHKMINRYLKQEEEIIFLVPVIREIRDDHPTISCRAMYYMINPVTIGRDKFEKICKDLGFVIEKKTKHIRTTDSTGVVKFDDLTRGFVLTDIDQIYSSDITYYKVGNGFYYITFILDCYTRRILGHSVSSRLFTEYTSLPALKMAIENKGNRVKEGIIFHSDGGGQYYDKEFLALTKKYKFKNSMCEYAWENGKAERINGIIKNNYLIHRKIETMGDLLKEVDRAVTLYNQKRPHKNLKYNTPMNFEKQLLNSVSQQSRR
jgi:putative transposase